METRMLKAEVPLPLADRLEVLAYRKHVAPESLVAEAVEAWISSEETRYRLTMEALDDAKHGRVIPHDNIAAWIDTLDDGDEEPSATS